MTQPQSFLSKSLTLILPVLILGLASCSTTQHLDSQKKSGFEVGQFARTVVAGIPGAMPLHNKLASKSPNTDKSLIAAIPLAIPFGNKESARKNAQRSRSHRFAESSKDSMAAREFNRVARIKAPKKALPGTKFARLQPNSQVIQIPKNGRVKVRTTAYTHTESDHLKYGRKNAIGTRLKYGAVCSAAADWSRFPLGTTFRINGGDQVFVVDDYGSALAGTNTLDLYMPSKKAMNRWGLRNVNIQILRWGSYAKSLKLMRQRSKAKHVRKMLVDLETRISTWKEQRGILAHEPVKDYGRMAFGLAHGS